MLLLLLLEDFPLGLAPLAPPLEADALAEEGPAPGFGCSFTIVPTAKASATTEATHV
jgi:hypothetical protein